MLKRGRVNKNDLADLSTLKIGEMGGAGHSTRGFFGFLVFGGLRIQFLSKRKGETRPQTESQERITKCLKTYSKIIGWFWVDITFQLRINYKISFLFDKGMIRNYKSQQNIYQYINFLWCHVISCSILFILYELYSNHTLLSIANNGECRY